ncbi:hypothetical protein Dimus_017136 [Dionaea muscipula]
MLSINFRIHSHKLALVEVEGSGSHTLQEQYGSLDSMNHVAQSMASLVNLSETMESDSQCNKAKPTLKVHTIMDGPKPQPAILGTSSSKIMKIPSDLGISTAMLSGPWRKPSLLCFPMCTTSSDWGVDFSISGFKSVILVEYDNSFVDPCSIKRGLY